MVAHRYVLWLRIYWSKFKSWWWRKYLKSFSSFKVRFFFKCGPPIVGSHLFDYHLWSIFLCFNNVFVSLCWSKYSMYWKHILEVLCSLHQKLHSSPSSPLVQIHVQLCISVHCVKNVNHKMCQKKVAQMDHNKK